MAKKKLQSFSADDASDDFTPTVKTFVSAEAPIPPGTQNPAFKSQAVPKVEKPAEPRTEDPPVLKDQSQRQTTPKTEKDNPIVSQVKAVPTPVQTNEPPAEKTVRQEPIAPLPTASLSAKASGNGQLSESVANVKPTSKTESKPADRKKTPITKPAPVDQAVQKQAETKEKTKAASQTHVELVGFILGKEEYAIEINKVQDINRMVEITRVPKAPDFVEGVMNLRGKVIPVIHLRKRFNLPDKPFDRSSRIIVVEVAGSIMGFIVDAITEVLRVPSHIIEQAPDLVTGIDSEYIMGVGKMQNRLLILIDLGKVLTKKTS